MNTITVNVTWAHINAPINESGYPDDDQCMIELAMIDCGFDSVDVGFSDIAIDGTEVAMPKTLAKLARDYDQRNGVAPFCFDVYMVDGLPVALSHPYWVKATNDTDDLIDAIDAMLAGEFEVQQ
jgi:hypothetical protein